MKRKKGMRGEDHGGGAVAALHAVRFAECVLKERQFAGPGRDPFDGRDGIAVGLHREHQARPDWSAVDEHGAGSADAVLAAGMRPGQQQALAQSVEQAHAGLDLERMGRAVDGKLNAHGRLARERLARRR